MTLYVTDMDGTLLNNGSFVSPLSAEIISDLSYDGALITVATARTPATVVPLMEYVHTSVPYIVLTGAATFDPVSLTFIDRNIIPPGDCLVLNGLFAKTDIHPFIYHFEDNSRLLVYHDPSMNHKEYEFYEERRNLALKHFIFEMPEHQERDVILYFAIGPEADIKTLASRIIATELFSVSCYPDIFSVGIYILEVYSLGVSKAKAVLDLKERLGADRLVVFGDNLNDLPMFEVADIAVAVANAQPRVKELADIVIGPNYDDSVAHFISDDFYSPHP